MKQGPLRDIRVIELAAIGPAPFACMLLSDMGADVIRIHRPDQVVDPFDIVNRGRTSLALDLKSSSGRQEVLSLVRESDVFIEGFRPGVIERLGLGPDDLHEVNPRLIIGRMTGWGQGGPLSDDAGHDINYIALTGALAAIGPKDGKPVIPLNLVGDYGGGSLYLVTGILAALHARTSTNKGQVVDAAIFDGVISLMSYNHSLALRKRNSEERGSNVLDGGAPYYNVYETSDHKFVSIGPVEAKFFDNVCAVLELPKELRCAQFDKTKWPELKSAFEAAFRSRTREEWCSIFSDKDACFAPVLTLAESASHPHTRSRDNFPNYEGVQHTAPAPRLSDTPLAIQKSKSVRSALEVMERWSGRLV